ncbi:MAG: OmpA family protein, partial [Novosphingobium sp.]
DIAGDPVANQDVSQKRADAVRQALIRRGIPAEGLRARGVGADEPLPDLAPSDPANRRIEFNVLLTRPQQPTPIDTPGPD